MKAFKKAAVCLTAMYLAVGFAGTAQADDILIGELHPLTGPASFYGIPESRGIQLAVEEINANGGVKIGDQAQQLRLITEDDHSNPTSAVAALKKLMEGNARYVDGTSKRHDFKHEREALVGGQNPYAAVLSCADSRIAPEYAFDSGRGDLFVCRVAGNFANDDTVASMEYTVAVL